MNDSPLKDRWYVDVRGNVSIMGTDEILERLYNGELKVVHRISRNKQDWCAICNEASFEKRLQDELKALSAETFGETPIVKVSDLEEGSKTELGFDVEAVQGQITDQLSQAKRMTELGLALSNVRRLLADISANKKTVHSGPVSTKEEDLLHVEDRDVFVKDAASIAQDKKVTRERMSKLIRVGGAICFFAFAISLVLDYQSEKEKKKEEVVAKQTSRTQLSTKYYSALNNLNMTGQPKVVGEVVTGTPVEVDPNDHFVERYHSALDFLQRGDYQSAEGALLDSLQYRGHDKAPVALALFETAWKLDLADIRVQRAQVAAAVSNGEQEVFVASYDRIRALKELLNKFTDPEHPLTGELSLVKVAVAVLLGEAELVNVARTFIEQYPHESAKTNLEPGLNYTRWSWYRMCPWLVEAMKDDRANAYLNASLASCMVRAENHLGSKPYIDYAYKKIPDDFSIEALAGHVYLLSGETDKAKAIIYKVTQNPRPSVVLSKSKDWLCAKFPNDENCVSRRPASATNTIVAPEQKTFPQKTIKKTTARPAARRK